jgi:hypothetical protein
MTAALIESAGYCGGDMKPGDDYNRDGYYENNPVTAMLVQYLRSCDSEGQYKQYQPLRLDKPWPGFGPMVEHLMRPCGPRWFYKNAKLLWTWRLWWEAFPDAKWILLQRNRERVLDSLLRAPFMDAYETREEWESYLDRCNTIMTDICRSVQYAHVVDVDNLVAMNQNEISTMEYFVGGTIDTRLIKREYFNS